MKVSYEYTLLFTHCAPVYYLANIASPENNGSARTPYNDDPGVQDDEEEGDEDHELARLCNGPAEEDREKQELFEELRRSRQLEWQRSNSERRLIG